MIENIELHKLKNNSISVDDTIEEYVEIKKEIIDPNISSPSKKETPNEYEFFTNFNVVTKIKEQTKHKKRKKKYDNTNLMDIINIELAAAEPLIEKNVVTFVDFITEERNSYIEDRPKLRQLARQGQLNYTDAENGWGTRKFSVINPSFPKVLESTTVESCKIPVVYFKPSNYKDIITNINKISPSENKFLDIKLQNLKFKVHHRFSLENLLSEKLLSAYAEYQAIRDTTKRLKKDIIVNRETKNNLKNELLKIGQKKDEIRYDPSIRKYTGQMLSLKNKLFEVIKKERETLNIIISIWSDISMIREKTNCVKTPYVLQITKEVIDDDDYDNLWAETFNTELNDLLDKVEYDFVGQYLKYKAKKAELGENNKLKKKLNKPKLYIDETYLNQQAKEITSNITRKENLEVYIKYKHNILTNSENFNLEGQKLIYYFKIYVDDVLVCESEQYIMNNDFEIHFTELFSVQILSNNYFIAIALLENDEQVSVVKINIQDVKKKFNVADVKIIEFLNESTIESNRNHIGSGNQIKEIARCNNLRLKSSNIFNGNLYTRGITELKVGWNASISDNNEREIKCVIEIEKKLQRLLNGTEKPIIDAMQDIIEKIYNQNIGDNEEMMHTLKSICNHTIRKENTINIDDSNVESARIKLLHLRNKGELSFSQNKQIPLYVSQISTEQLNALQKYNESGFHTDIFRSDKYTNMDPIELQRIMGQKYIKNMNNSLLRILNETLFKKTYKDVVFDYSDLRLRGLFTNQRNLGKLSGLKKLNFQDFLSKEQDINITIMRAFNLPDRALSILSDENIDDHIDDITGFKLRSLRPFVEINYQGSTVHTATAIGCHPTWNQTLKIKTSAGQLSSIHINLFDEQRTTVKDDEKVSAMHYRCYNKWLGTLEIPLYSVFVSGQINGTFKINTPSVLFGYEIHTDDKETARSIIPAVTQLLRKEASFLSLQIRLNSSHSGYTERYDLPTPNNSEDDYVIKHLNAFVTEYLVNFPKRNISLTLIDSAGKNKCVSQFLQPIPLPDYENFSKNPKRSESAISKSSNVSKSSSSKSFDVKTKSDTEKESIYSSYEGRTWRKDDNGVETMINAAVRYVSLIPSYTIAETHVVTLMGLELLKILHGSHLDHSILLASYFLHLGLKTYIAIGFSLLGRSSFVLTKYNLKKRRMVLSNDQVHGGGFLSRNDDYLWYVYDGIGGEKFQLRDVGCPLKTVEYIFDSENIWVNMQSSLDCENVSFDLTKSSDWKPVFDKNIFIMKHAVVADVNLYTNVASVEQLRNNLEGKIKQKIQKWRPHVKTVWNRYCSSLLRETLPQWEHWALNPEQPRPGLGQRLRQLLVTYKVFGFPINMPFISSRTVVSRLKSTRVHMNAEPSVEFGLAVEVYAYPNGVVSVWVFLASISRI